MRSLFDDRNIKPMLIAENVEPFDNPDWIYEFKWDGERCIAYLDPKTGTELRNKRNVKMLSKVQMCIRDRYYLYLGHRLHLRFFPDIFFVTHNTTMKFGKK